jgi:opacity protein-like surface antigen
MQAGLRLTGGALLAAALIGSAGTAGAQDLLGGSWYVKGFGGATWPSSQDTDIGGTDFELDYDTGYTLGVSLGYLFTPNVAFEIEYAYRDADVTGELGGASDDGSTSANAFMANAVYWFDPLGAMGAVQPYLGAGLGAARVDTDLFGDSWDTDTTFAWQVMGGIGYDVTPNWTLLGEVRWFATQDDDFNGPGDLSFETSFETFDLLVGASYSF